MGKKIALTILSDTFTTKREVTAERRGISVGAGVLPETG